MRGEHLNWSCACLSGEHWNCSQGSVPKTKVISHLTVGLRVTNDYKRKFDTELRGRPSISLTFEEGKRKMWAMLPRL